MDFCNVDCVFRLSAQQPMLTEDLTDWSHYTEDGGSYFTVSGTTATISQTSSGDAYPWSKNIQIL